jgi:hypothetical protein
MGSSGTVGSTNNVMVEKPSFNLRTASGLNTENIQTL